jgi:hypothetical protein
VAGYQKQTVVEIKVAQDPPSWLRELLRRHPHSNFSKFLTSTQTLLIPGEDGVPAENPAGADDERRRAVGGWRGLDGVARDCFTNLGESEVPPKRA